MSSLTREQRRIVPLVFAVTLTSIMGNALLAPVIPDILDTFDRPDSDGGYLVAATSLPGIFVAPIIGILADRLGRKAVLIPCLVVFGAAGVATVLAPTFEVMVATRFAMGFGAAGLINLAVVLLSDTFPPSERTTWLGRNAGVLTVALAICPVVSGLIADVAGWRWSLAPYSIGLFTAVAAWFVLEPGRPSDPATLRAQLGGVRVALTNPVVAITLVAGSVSFAAVFGVYLTALPTHLEDDFGMSAASRGLVLGLPAITSSIAAFNLGRVRSRVAIGRLLVLSSVLWIVSFLLIGFTGSVVVLGLGALLYGVGDGWLIPALQDVALRNAPDDHRGAVMATWTAFARLGQTVGPILAAVTIAGAGSGRATAGGAVATLIMLVLFLSPPMRRAA